MDERELGYAAEYHRGYEDGARHRKAETWQLDQRRLEVASRLRRVHLRGGSHEMLSQVCRAVHPAATWTQESVEALVDELAYLMTGDWDGRVAGAEHGGRGAVRGVRDMGPAESIVRDLVLGIASERETVRRIERYAGGAS